MKQTLLFIFILFSTASYAQIIIRGSPPTVTGQPVAYQVVCNGSTATLSITASGSFPLSYQWYSNPRNGCEFCDILLTDGSQFSGTTTPSLNINTTGFFGGGTYYYCYVTNAWGTDYSQDGSIGVASVPASPTTTGASSCVPASLTLTASPAGRAEYYNWYDQGGVLIPGENGMTYKTPVLSASTNYFVALTTGTCESPTTVVTAQINIVTPPSATGNSACGSSAVTLNASGGTAGQYRWYTSAGVLIAGQTNSSYITPVITVTTNYSVSINNGTCESSKTSVTATINTPPAAPAATGNSACGSSAVTLNASGGTAGQYLWYTSAGVLIVGQTNSSYLTPVITMTTNYSVSINNGTCESSKISVTATINTPPAAPAATGNSACGSSAITLSASGGTAGQYQWYTSAGVLIAGQTNSSYTTPVITLTTNYSVSINNGTCESSKTSVTATINNSARRPCRYGKFSLRIFCYYAQCFWRNSRSIPMVHQRWRSYRRTDK